MKKLITIISLFVTFCVSAQAQTLTTFAFPVGTVNPIINSLTSISADSALVAGSFTGFNSPDGTPLVSNVNNIAIITSDGTISPLGNGIPDEVVATTKTDDGKIWAITKTTLWQFTNQTGVQMPVQITTGNIKKCFGTKTNDIILLGNLNQVSGINCQNVIRFNAATQTLDTLGLSISLGNVSTQNDEGNFIAITQNDSAVFFTWQDYVTSNFNCLYKYDLYTNTASLMSSAPPMIIPRVITWSDNKNALYYFGLGADNNRYVWGLINGQWNQILLVDQDIFSMTPQDDKVYISGFFNEVNGQPIQKTAVLNETSSVVNAWNIGISATPHASLFFQNGRTIASTKYTLAADFPTGISEGENNLLQVYPNPTQTIVTLDGTKYGENIVLSDILGNIILSQKSVGQKITFNIQHLTPGIYFLKGKNFTKKVLFQ